jgi:hypothetical protein
MLWFWPRPRLATDAAKANPGAMIVVFAWFFSLLLAVLLTSIDRCESFIKFRGSRMTGG